jgi:hypothetical protein
MQFTARLLETEAAACNLNARNRDLGLSAASLAANVLKDADRRLLNSYERSRKWRHPDAGYEIELERAGEPRLNLPEILARQEKI